MLDFEIPFLLYLCRLKIDEITLDDSGVYTCVGFNQYGRQATNGSVVVKQGELVHQVTSNDVKCYSIRQIDSNFYYFSQLLKVFQCVHLLVILPESSAYNEKSISVF